MCLCVLVTAVIPTEMTELMEMLFGGRPQMHRVTCRHLTVAIKRCADITFYKGTMYYIENIRLLPGKYD